MIILNHGFRPLEGLVYPVNLFGLTLKQLESIRESEKTQQ